ncbi:MAG: hypothetical protein WD576_01645 [Nitriliruptoraceae bacterium]
MTDHHCVDLHLLRRLQLPWWLSAGVLVIAMAVAASTGPTGVSSLPVILPVGLLAAAACGALATMVAIRNSLPRQDLATGEHARAAFRAHQALLLVIALAPPLLAAALTAAFGHVATIVTGALVGLVLVVYGLPTQATVRELNAKLADHGHHVVILRSNGDE